MKTFKRTLSLLLAVCVLASMAVIATVSASADDSAAKYPDESVTTVPVREDMTRPVVTDVVNSDVDEDGQPTNQVATRRYYFYMPDGWYNDRNGNYDASLGIDGSCAAGIYWYTGSYNCKDYMGKAVKDWPGHLVVQHLTDYPNIWFADVPEDATSIVWNNMVDGGEGGTGEDAGFNFQTADIFTQYIDVDDDPYAFYENGLESMDGMIFVCNPVDTSINPLSGVVTQKGEWFYYYGEGKYGLEPTIEAAGDSVFNNGDFPSSLQIDTTNTYNYLNDGGKTDIYCNADPAELTVTSEDESLATVSEVSAVTGDAMWKSKVTVTGVAEGIAKITFKETKVDLDTGKESYAFRSCVVENLYKTPKITAAASKTIYVGKTAKAADSVKYAKSVTYKSSKTSVATVSASGVITAKAAGTANITITAKAGEKTATATVKVTVKKNANPIKVTAKAVTGNSKKATTFTAAKFATVKGAQGKVTYKKASGDKKITVTAAGKMTVGKGLKKGKTYAVKIKVTAAGNAKYAAATKSITVKVKIK